MHFARRVPSRSASGTRVSFYMTGKACSLRNVGTCHTMKYGFCVDIRVAMYDSDIRESNTVPSRYSRKSIRKHWNVEQVLTKA